MALTDPRTTPSIPERDRGRQLRAVRKARGLSRSEVARSAGLTRRELAAYERGRNPVPDSDLWCLAGSCGVDVDDLLPTRDRLGVASDLGTLTIGESVRRLRPGTDADGVLREYLEMIYELRNLAPGSTTSMRAEDLATLADALGGTPDAIEARLHDLVGASRAEAARLRAMILMPPPAAATAATAAPVAPVAPVAPTAPVAPVPAAAPVAPVAPGPGDPDPLAALRVPVTPTAPVAPVPAAAPVAPVAPPAPAAPVAPPAPVAPVAPPAPVAPVAPVPAAAPLAPVPAAAREARFVPVGTAWQLGGDFPSVSVTRTGALRVRRADVRWALADLDVPGDLTIRATVDFTSGVGCGILFRASTDGAERLHGYSFDIDPVYSGGGFLLRQWSDGHQHWQPLAHARVDDPVGLYGTHAIEVSLHQDTLVARVDGTVVMTLIGLAQASRDAGHAPCDGRRVGIQAWSTTEVVVDRMMVASR